jgi:hypothetical protein
MIKTSLRYQELVDLRIYLNAFWSFLDSGSICWKDSLIVNNSKENAEIAVKLDIHRSKVKIEEIKMAAITVEIRMEAFIALIVASLDM